MALPKNYYKYLSYPLCKVCGKVSYPSQERAMYAALIVGITFGCKLRAYRRQRCFYAIANKETWHISKSLTRVKRKSTNSNFVIDDHERELRRKENRRGKARKLRRRLRLGLTRRQVGL